jgi:hypothetical protein
MATSRTGTSAWLRIVRERRRLDQRAGITRCPMCGRLLDWEAKRVRGQAHNPARVEVDHIVPHEHGGKDTLENSRCICADCNLKRRGREAGNRLVVLLCGPPGAGKTTAARASGLQVYDRDDPQWHGEAQFRAALRHLGAQRTAQAVVIRAGASSSARRSAAQLMGATHTYLMTEPIAELKRRLVERRRDDWRGTILGVDRWHEQHDRDDSVMDFPGWDSVSLGTKPIEWPEPVHSAIW